MSDYQFVSQDTAALMADMIAAYEAETGHTCTTPTLTDCFLRGLRR